MHKILIVDDERELVEGLEMNLQKEGYRIYKAFDGQSAIRTAFQELPHVIILDLMIPGPSGLDVIRELKKAALNSRIIVLSALTGEVDRVVGLEMGADDYVSKPFSLRELQARIHARLRRQDNSGTVRLSRYQFNDIQIDFDKFLVVKNGKPVSMTTKEMEVIRLLIVSRGEVVSRDTLLEQVWGYESYPSTRTVDNHILKLRKKLEPDPSNPRYILSIYGGGYKFVG